MENKVENQKVTKFFENTAFACADSKSKLWAYQEAVAVGCHTLRETYDDLVRFKFSGVMDYDTDKYDTLYDVYHNETIQYEELHRSDVAQYEELHSDNEDDPTSCDEDLADENILQLIIHIILTYPPDPEASKPRRFTNLVSLLLTRFKGVENLDADVLFRIIIEVDDLELYMLFYTMLEPKERNRLLPIHYKIAGDVADKHDKSQICVWISPPYIKMLCDHNRELKLRLHKALTILNE